MYFAVRYKKKASDASLTTYIPAKAFFKP